MYWLAGLLEGEGSFMKGSPSKSNQPVVSIEITDEDTANRVGKIFETKVYYLASRNKKWKPTFALRLRGKRAVELMKKLFPIMSKRRKEQINRAILSYVDLSSKKGIILKENKKEIINRLKNHEKVKDIARKFKVGESAIYKLKYRFNKKGK